MRTGADVGQNGVRGKIRAGQASAVVPIGGAEAAWKLALGRAARDTLSLDLAVERTRYERRTLSELLELPPERALIAVLDGPGEGLGLIVLSSDMLAAVTEMQTIGRVTSGVAPVRLPTRTDAAMTGDLIDTALSLLEAELREEDDLIWAGGFRYASFLEDARPLALLLEDITYRVMVTEASLGGGAKRGEIIVALPSEGRGAAPVRRPTGGQADAGAAFRAGFGEKVMASEALLHAVVARITLPIHAVMALTAGDPLALGLASLDRIDLETVEGLRLAGGRLGQNRGMRAVRMVQDALPAERLRRASDTATAPTTFQSRMQRPPEARSATG